MRGCIYCSALDALQPRVVSYEEQVTAIREQLAELLEDEEDWAKAAKVLAGIDLDSGRSLSLASFAWHPMFMAHTSVHIHKFKRLPRATAKMHMGHSQAPESCGDDAVANFALMQSASVTGMRVLDDEYKLRQNIKIAMLYLEDDDAVSAEIFIKKAATLIASCKVSRLSRPSTLRQHFLV